MNSDRDHDYIHTPPPDLLNVELPGGRIDVFGTWPSTASVALEADLSAEECRQWALGLTMAAAAIEMRLPTLAEVREGQVPL